jgi:hypothetical protein
VIVLTLVLAGRTFVDVDASAVRSDSVSKRTLVAETAETAKSVFTLFAAGTVMNAFATLVDIATVVEASKSKAGSTYAPITAVSILTLVVAALCAVRSAFVDVLTT